jgi:hypothetical protein
VLARMTGSGSTVAGILDPSADPAVIATRLRALLPGTVLITSTVAVAASVEVR